MCFRGREMLQYDEADLAEFGGYDLVHHDDLSYVASAHQECKPPNWPGQTSKCTIVVFFFQC